MTLSRALEWAARGFRIFPIWAGGKEPAFDGWTHQATTDPDVIRQWWALPDGSSRNFNIGVLTTGMCVVDVDTKGGKPGLRTALEIGLDFDTLCVKTPTGGYHLYYQTDGHDYRSTVEGLGPGVDTRGFNGYVIAPGSVVDGKVYELHHDAPMKRLRGDVAAQLARSAARVVEPPKVDLDLPASFLQAAGYLQRALPAIEGRGGNAQTYEVAAMVRDFGLSEGAATDLLLQQYNPKCVPPWDEADLRTIVRNVYEYAQNAAGSKSILLDTEGINIPEPPPLLASRVNGVRPSHEIPPRPWVIPRLLMKGFTTLLMAEGSAGKSTLTLTLAAHMALGRDFLGYKIKRRYGSVIYNAEDDRDEMERRMHALCTAYGFDVHEVMDRICIVEPPQGVSLELVQADPFAYNHQLLDELTRAAKQVDAGMVALDPLVELHSCREDDNVQMRFVMATLRLLSRMAGCAVLVSHHVNKVALGGDTRAGNQNIGRGASAIVNAARIALTMVPPTDKDMEDYALPDADRLSFVRLDDAKMNMALRSADPHWLQRRGVTLANGDDVGVLVPLDAEGRLREERRKFADLVAQTMVLNATAYAQTAEVAQWVQRMDPLLAQLKVEDVKVRLERWLDPQVTSLCGPVRIAREVRRSRTYTFVHLG